jgi:hypothetical protein
LYKEVRKILQHIAVKTSPPLKKCLRGAKDTRHQNGFNLSVMQLSKIIMPEFVFHKNGQLGLNDIKKMY